MKYILRAIFYYPVLMLSSIFLLMILIFMLWDIIWDFKIDDEWLYLFKSYFYLYAFKDYTLYIKGNKKLFDIIT